MIKIGSPSTEKIYVEATQLLGHENQTTVAVEELSELIQAVTKLKRGYTGDKYMQNLGEEIAHVLLMINQLIVMFSVGDIVDLEYKKAVKRLINIMYGEKLKEDIE